MITGASEEAMDKLIGEPGFYAQVLNIINQYRGFIDPMNFSKGNKNLPSLVNSAKVSSVIDEILRSKIRNIISRITKAAKDKLNDLTESYRIQLDESANQCSDKEQKHKLEIENEKLLIERKKSIIEKNVMGLGWLGKLYPQSITKAHIVFMSFKKFLTKDTQIVESTNDFQIEKWMKNSLIYIDEFDAAKEILWEDILENNKKSFDFIRTLWDIYKAISFGAQDINICHAFHMGQSDTPERFINESDDSARKYYNKHLSEIKDRIDALNEKFKIDWNYKLLDEDVDKKICVLINSSTYHSMSKTGKPLLYGKIDNAHCKVLMHFVSENEVKSESCRVHLVGKESVLSLIHQLFLHLVNHINGLICGKNHGQAMFITVSIGIQNGSSYLVRIGGSRHGKVNGQVFCLVIILAILPAGSVVGAHADRIQLFPALGRPFIERLVQERNGRYQVQNKALVGGFLLYQTQGSKGFAGPTGHNHLAPAVGLIVLMGRIHGVLLMRAWVKLTQDGFFTGFSFIQGDPVNLGVSQVAQIQPGHRRCLVQNLLFRSGIPFIRGRNPKTLCKTDGFPCILTNEGPGRSPQKAVHRSLVDGGILGPAFALDSPIIAIDGLGY